MSYTFSFGKHKGQSVEDVMRHDAQYLEWIYDSWESVDLNLLQFIEANIETIRANARREHNQFMYERCDGEVCVPH